MQTLKDKLSRLTFRQACKWLGADGETLLKAGGKRTIDLEEQVHLSDDGFTLTLPGAAVTISPYPHGSPIRAPDVQRLPGGVRAHGSGALPGP
ncbi:MAG: hypothetical protein C4529_02700 [Deltaproteobacteria bacterium]|nr:MAG: hypothetical protein C4529_02700 [Deltaproteobacteria bacterium]